MPTTETLQSVTRDPASFIDRAALRHILRRLRAELDDRGATRRRELDWLGDSDARPSDGQRPAVDTEQMELAAIIHRFVYTRGEYGDDLDGGLNRSPRETLLEDGNCADQSLLLYALYREADITARLTVVEQVDGPSGHAFVECGFDAASDAVTDALTEHYRDTELVSSGRFHFFEDDDLVYFLADPVASRFLGDRQGPDEMGYVGADGSLRVNRRFTLYGATGREGPAEPRATADDRRLPE